MPPRTAWAIGGDSEPVSVGEAAGADAAVARWWDRFAEVHPWNDPDGGARIRPSGESPRCLWGFALMDAAAPGADNH